jgi:hypothetical protein
MKKYLLPLTCILYLSSCRVSLLPNYDPDIAQQIINTAKANDKLYLELLAASTDKRDYKDYQQEYLQIEVEINSINFKEQIRKKDTDMLALVKDVHTHFSKYQRDHKNSPVPLSDAEIYDYEMYMTAFWKTLFVAEDELPNKK